MKAICKEISLENNSYECHVREKKNKTELHVFIHEPASKYSIRDWQSVQVIGD